VVVRPPGAVTGLLLARADGPEQAAGVGRQAAGRVGFILRVDDFGAAHQRMMAAGVEFTGPPRAEPYGQVAVFRDIAGNKWALGPLAASSQDASSGSTHRSGALVHLPADRPGSSRTRVIGRSGHLPVSRSAPDQRMSPSP
jgi:hypothetical protein